MKPDLRHLKNHMREHLLEKENIETEVEDWIIVTQNLDEFFYVCRKVKNAYFVSSIIYEKVTKFSFKDELVGKLLAKASEIENTMIRINVEMFTLRDEMRSFTSEKNANFQLGSVVGSCLEDADFNLNELRCHIEAAIACLTEGQNAKGVKDN